MKKIYQLKIALKHVKPPIWRRVQVPSDMKLSDLSKTIIHAMGWYGYHLMSFEVGRKAFYDEAWAEELGGIPMHLVTLNACLKEPKQKMLFTYDFGDDWRHDVLLEKILDPEPGAVYPRCTAGKRNCPPEDCGGPWRYSEMLEALGDPSHPEHKYMVEWVGRGFDPEAFDVEGVNGRMKIENIQ